VHAVLNLLVYAALNLKVLVVAQCLRARRNVRVPRVLDALSCKSVLTMEYVEDMFKVSPWETSVFGLKLLVYAALRC